MSIPSTINEQALIEVYDCIAKLRAEVERQKAIVVDMRAVLWDYVNEYKHMSRCNEYKRGELEDRARTLLGEKT
jgi:hypothetical protein